MLQMVFFTREADKLPRGDSSIAPHDAADRVRIDPEVHGADRLLPGRPVLQVCFFRVCEP